jgi:molybdenum cofactor cytidylyltransferase
MNAAGIGTIVLAAGKGRRIGTAKLRLLAGDESFLHRCVRIAHASGADPVYCVVSFADAVWAAGEVPDARVLVNADESGDMLSSVRVGLGAFSDAAGALVLPVDHPFVLENTLKRLIAAGEARRGLVVKPTFNGRAGHPVLVPRGLFPAILDAESGTTLRAIINESGIPLHYVDVDDASVLRNVNTPDDLISE